MDEAGGDAKLTAKQRKALRERERRAAASITKRGYVAKPGHQSYLSKEEEEHLYGKVLDVIRISIHHPPIWLCEQVSIHYIFNCYYFVDRLSK